MVTRHASCCHNSIGFALTCLPSLRTVCSTLPENILTHTVALSNSFYFSPYENLSFIWKYWTHRCFSLVLSVKKTFSFLHMASAQAGICLNTYFSARFHDKYYKNNFFKLLFIFTFNAWGQTRWTFMTKYKDIFCPWNS